MTRQVSTRKKRVLFLCTGNSARSQMAEGLLRHLAGERFEAESAGTHPVGLNPMAVAVMRELGADISQHTSKRIDAFEGQRFDHVITVCDRAREACPIWPAATSVLHWSFDDPAGASGPPDTRLATFRRIRDEIAVAIRRFLDSQGVESPAGQTSAPASSNHPPPTG